MGDYLFQDHAMQSDADCVFAGPSKRAQGRWKGHGLDYNLPGLCQMRGPLLRAQ